MAEFQNPDFTKINLSNAPQQSEAEWKTQFEKAAAAN